jgi:hypothetical protein
MIHTSTFASHSVGSRAELLHTVAQNMCLWTYRTTGQFAYFPKRGNYRENALVSHLVVFNLFIRSDSRDCPRFATCISWQNGSLACTTHVVGSPTCVVQEFVSQINLMKITPPWDYLNRGRRTAVACCNQKIHKTGLEFSSTLLPMVSCQRCRQYFWILPDVRRQHRCQSVLLIIRSHVRAGRLFSSVFLCPITFVGLYERDVICIIT